jgi:hypothetical protein
MKEEFATPPAVAGASQRVKNMFKKVGRRNCVLITFAVIAVAAAFSGSGLVAIGIPPLLLSLLPCLAMCALGLCKKSGNGESRCAGKKGMNIDSHAS